MVAVNPTLIIRCPYCWRESHPGDCAIYSTITPGKLLHPAPKPGTREYELSRTWIEDLDGPERAMELPVRQCPHCGELLFEGIEECETANIAVIGDTSSGKTHYIAVLIDQLKRCLTEQGNAIVEVLPLNKFTEETYRTAYYEPIIKNCEIVAPNRRGGFDAQGRPVRSKPLIFRLNIMDMSVRMNKSINILLFDISGEELADGSALVQFAEHVLRADGIIYLADPMSMDHIRNKVQNSIPTSSVTGRPAQETLSLVMKLLRSFTRVRSGERIRVPMAIAISKADLLRYVIDEQERTNYQFWYRPRYDGRAHLEDLMKVDRDVRTILNDYAENSLANMTRLFDHASFFAISATGGPPDEYGKYDRIVPHRCLDPFIWLLWKRRFLQGER